jgi:3-deoxy-D-manno-octulosonate 8-phosphate phosphatase (KDO 8-P phosphatase)
VDGVVRAAADPDDVAALAPPLLERELQARAARLRLVLSDVDGTLTDGGVYYSERGEAMKRFSLRDGMGVERLRDDGVETALVTRETSPIVARRAEKLRVRRLYEGVADKQGALDTILAETGYDLSQIAYIGDDVNDLGIMSVIARRGLTAAPLDAVPSVLRSVHYRCARGGGGGAFRDFAEWILDLRQLARRPRAFDVRLVDPAIDEKGGML